MILQDLSPKQIQSFREANARLNIWEGAVRSGKSHASIIRFLDFIIHGPKGTLIAIGKTNTAIKRNFVDPLLDMLGLDVKYYAGKQEVHLYGKTIVLVGANDERAEGKIRGNTYAGAYVDELTLLPESFFTTLLARLSVDGAKLFATTNPDSPFHWFKTNYLDRSDTLDLKRFQFRLEDNPSLTEGFKTNLKQEFRGLWYKRFIEGQWVLAEGSIYDFFDEKIHCVDCSSFSARYYVCGIDYGTSNPCAFVLIGYNPENYPNLWVAKEYYWDSKEKNRQKTDSEYADDLKRFLYGINIKAIVVDPSAASFKAELIKNGFSGIMDANNDVLDGIRFTSKLLSNGTLKISDTCKNLIKEIQTYVWDEKSIKLGEDKPLKQNDHCFIAGTLITTDKGQTPIEQIKVGDKVLTPVGYKQVLKTFIHEAEVNEYEILGKKMVCTPEHQFYTANRGWIKACDLIQSDMLLINISGDRCLTQLNGMDTNGTEVEPLKTCVIENIIEDMTNQQGKTDISIEMYGNSIMEKFHEDVIYITSMKTPPIMTLAISNVYQLLSIFPNMGKTFRKHEKKLCDKIAKESGLLQRNGMHPKKGLSGIKNMLKRAYQKLICKDSVCCVANAELNSKGKKKTRDFARIIVSLNGEERLILMMSLKNVQNVIKSLQQTSIQEPSIVLGSVLPLIDGKRNVYNLMIEDMPMYFAEDILVHNCLDSVRYSLNTWFSPIYNGTGEMDVEQYRRWKSEYGWR